MIRSDFTINPLGQIKILTDLSVLRDFKNNPLGFHEIPKDSANPLGFYTFTGKYLTWQVQIRKK